MRTNVTFRHLAEFVGDQEDGGVLAMRGAQWFAALLRRSDKGDGNHFAAK
jgi:hypothetical protein